MSAPSASSFKSKNLSVISRQALVDERSFAVKIDDFDRVRQSVELTNAQRFEFKAGTKIGLPTKWLLSLKAAADHIEGWLTLIKAPEDAKNVNISCSMGIRKQPSDVLFVNHNERIKNMIDEAGKMTGAGYPLISRDVKLEDLPLIDGSVIIEIEFKLYTHHQAAFLGLDVPTKVKQFELKSKIKLNQDLERIGSLTTSATAPDSVLKIISKDGVVFPVKWKLLAVRSSACERMLHQKSKGTDKKLQVHNMDLSSKTLKVILCYIHSGTLDRDWKANDVIEELTLAAKMFELDLLTEFLEEIQASVSNKWTSGQLQVLEKNLNKK